MAALRRVSKFLRGRSWYLDYYDEAGHRRQPSKGPISEPEAELHRQHLELMLNGHIGALPSTPAGPLLSLFAEEYLAWYQAEYPSSYPRTEGACRNYLLPALGHLALGNIARHILEKYKAARRPNAKPATVKKELNIIQAMLNKAVEWEYLPANRARGVKAPQDLDAQPAPCYTAEELGRIYAQSPDKWAIWKLIANTGLRRTEALNLKWENVQGDTLYVISTPTARSKSGRYRVIPLSPGAREALAALKSPSPHVLPRMVPWSLSRAFRHVLRRAGLPGSLHALRHTFCSHLVMRGVDLRTVQELAGHATITITMKQYVHLSQGHTQAAVQQLDL